MNETLLALLEASLSAEFGPRPRVAALATGDAEGFPHVRHVVVRRVDSRGLWIAVDSRSEKVGHLRSRPRAEIAFWLSTRREQFRISGVAEQIDDRNSGDARSLWSALTDASRALFVWPDPGAPRADDLSRFPATVALDSTIPGSFLPLRLVPDVVEQLELSPHPHRRRRWRAARSWQEEELNP